MTDALPRYSNLPFPVRPDIEDAHRRAWQRLARPGTWWTGAERVAIAAETRAARSCAVCSRRKIALSPFAVDGAHDCSAVLPPTVVDLVHRVTTDPGRLSRKWFEGLLADGLEEAHYVEALGVVVRTVATDAFCRAVGSAPHPLPEPQPGEPSRELPDGAGNDGAWVSTLPNGHAFYEDRSFPNVGRALSLVPEEVRGIVDLMPALYMDVGNVADPSFDPGRAISRAQIELIAARVSSLNECFY